MAAAGCTVQQKHMTTSTTKEPEKVVVNKVYTESYPVEAYPSLPQGRFVNDKNVVVVNNQSTQPEYVPMQNNGNLIIMDGNNNEASNENLKSAVSTVSIESEVNTTMNDLTQEQPPVVNEAPAAVVNPEAQTVSPVNQQEEHIDLSTNNTDQNNTDQVSSGNVSTVSQVDETPKPPTQTLVITDENMNKVNSQESTKSTANQPGSFNNPIKFVQ